MASMEVESTVSVSDDAVARGNRQYEDAAKAALIAAAAVDENASFGIEEGEVDQLERKWITWCAHARPHGAA